MPAALCIDFSGLSTDPLEQNRIAIQAINTRRLAYTDQV